MAFIRLFNRSGPKIKVETLKKDGFSGWLKCTECGETTHAQELLQCDNCCPKCNYHYRLTVAQRLKGLTDEGSAEEFFEQISTSDPLQFVDQEPYPKRVEQAKEKCGRSEAVWAGKASIEGNEVSLAILDFSFMGGSMGSVVGEKLTRLIEYSIREKLPLVIVSASGGARMQESVLSLMQMAKISAALGKLSEKKLPFISVLTNPTMGGVTASFASLGDVIIAEPQALIGFAGPRVVEQALRSKLPEGAQRSEFLQEKGMIDKVVQRGQLKKTIAFFITFLKEGRKRESWEIYTEEV